MKLHSKYNNTITNRKRQLWRKEKALHFNAFNGISSPPPGFFEQKIPHFHFVLGPTSFVVGLENEFSYWDTRISCFWSFGGKFVNFHERITQNSSALAVHMGLLVRCQTGSHVPLRVITYQAILLPWPNGKFSLMPIRLVCRSSLVLALDAKWPCQ